MHVAFTKRTNGRSLGTFKKRKFLWKIGEHWIGEYFHLFLIGLVELRDFSVGSIAYIAICMDWSRFASKSKQNAVERQCYRRHTVHCVMLVLVEGIMHFTATEPMQLTNTERSTNTDEEFVDTSYRRTSPVFRSV
jgi:hypothetical protein